MEFESDLLLKYLEQHSSPEPAILSDLRRETWQKVLNPRMLSGAIQGRFLSMISQLVKPQMVVEIGTYTAYATLCLAEGLTPNGTLISIDKNEELVPIQEKFISKSPFASQIKLLTGDAIELIPTLNETIDLVFIDADKVQNKKYFDLLLPKVKEGGIILIDNVLWNGKVLDVVKNSDIDTRAIHDFNRYLRKHNQIEVIMIPIRDGISMVKKSTFLK